jgi:hypothetical protein
MVGAPVDLGTIRVSAGEETRDPRLQAIDVDSELHRFEIQARAIDGRALPFSLRARVVGAEEDFDWRGDAYDGSFRVASVSPEIEVLVSATGFRTITAICRPGITSVVLPPALAIQLSIDGVADWLGSSFELVPMLVHRERGDNENEQALAFDREGKCRFTVSNPGEHEVWFRIRANGGRTGEGFASDPPERIDVRDTSERQTFQVHLARESAPLLRIEDLKDELLRGAIK